ncbi:unnamed protein product [Cochlearia groenlandica]
MASTHYHHNLLLLKPLSPLSPLSPSFLYPKLKIKRTHFTKTKCSSSKQQDPKDHFQNLTPSPESINTTSAENFPIEKRRISEITTQRRREDKKISKPEPPNLEIGWQRTKEINFEKPKGYVIMDFLEKLEALMERELFGSKELLVKAGEIVAERAREEAEDLREDGEVEERLVTELLRVLRLMEMDLAMVKASVKEDTICERILQAKVRCRQAILVANSF